MISAWIEEIFPVVSEHTVAGLCAETELLLCCARTSIDPQMAERIESLVHDGVDWEYLVPLSRSLGVLPLLYRSLNDICPHAVPEGFLDQLRELFSANVRKILFLFDELLKVLDLLDHHGIEAIPFKGPVLAAAAYGDLTLRQAGDLDILIHRRDLEKAKKLFLAEGYRLWRELTKLQEDAHLRSAHAYTFVRPDRKVTVDLHWRIAQEYFSFALDPEILWSRLERVSISERNLPTLHQEDLLLILCMHASKQCWKRLAWICDVAELVRRHEGMDWGRVLQQSARMASERVLLVGLYLAGNLLRTTLPKEVLSKIDKDPAVKSIALNIRKRLFSRNQRPLGVVEGTALFLRMRERFGDKFPYLLHRLRVVLTPNERDLSLLPLPTFLYFLYYPLRLLRLMAISGLGTAGRFHRSK